MLDEKISQKSRLKKKDKTKQYFIEEIEQNDINYSVLNYIKHLLILVSMITGCVSISAFASLGCTPIGIESSAVALKICIITAGINKYKSVIKKKRKHDKIGIK